MTTPNLQHISISDIRPSPLNPRTSFDEGKLAELAADIAQRGVMQPVLVRPMFEKYELVFGHRRVKAAEMAGLTSVPAFVEDLADEDVLEAALVENLQREDLHPLDFADGLRRLHQEHKVPVDQLAERIGKSKATVYASLKLAELTPKSRELFRTGKLSFSVAQLVARIPNAKLQDEAAKDIAAGRFGEPLSFRDARELVTTKYMLALKSAPFDPKDASLCPQLAGSCEFCPKRTGAQPELFKDIPSADVCTDPDCYQAKADAWWELKVAASKNGGGPAVLSKTETKRVFDRFGQLNHDAPYVRADAVCSEDPQLRTYAKLLGKGITRNAILARDESGTVHKLLPREGLKDALEDAGHDFKKRREADPEAQAEKERRALEKKKAARAKAVADKAVAAMVSIVEAKEPDRKFWALLASMFEAIQLENTLRRRCKLDEQKDAELGLEEQQRYLSKVPGMNEGQLRAFVFEAVLEGVRTLDGGYVDTFKAAAEHFKVDLGELEKEVKAEEKAAAEPKDEGGAERVAKKVRAMASKAKLEGRA